MEDLSVNPQIAEQQLAVEDAEIPIMVSTISEMAEPACPEMPQDICEEIAPKIDDV